VFEEGAERQSKVVGRLRALPLQLIQAGDQVAKVEGRERSRSLGDGTMISVGRCIVCYFPESGSGVTSTLKNR
jgi:hypothetical protein